MKDKNISLIIKELAKISDMVLAVKLDSERAEKPDNITRFFKERGSDAITVKDIREAFLVAKKKAGKDGLICVTGSFLTVAEACKTLKIKV
jgi:folylpolyglutamate synthase/dihydropteroate synthase